VNVRLKLPETTAQNVAKMPQIVENSALFSYFSAGSDLRISEETNKRVVFHQSCGT
jgi:hypothetical protein